MNKLVADRETCIGSGNCVRVAARVFEQDDDGRVFVLDEADIEANVEEIEMAVEACPIGAIEFD